MRKILVNGKERRIVDIRFDTPSVFEAYYKNHFICVRRLKQGFYKPDRWDFFVNAPDGCYIVNDYCNVGEKTFDEVLIECVENILL